MGAYDERGRRHTKVAGAWLPDNPQPAGMLPVETPRYDRPPGLGWGRTSHALYDVTASQIQAHDEGSSTRGCRVCTRREQRRERLRQIF